MTQDTNLTIVAADEFAAAEYHMALAAEHSQLATTHLARYYQSLPGGGITAGDLRGGSRSGPRCVKVWTDWLNDNGPAYRQDITEATGMKFTERGTPYTVEWLDEMVSYPDDHFHADTIVRVRGIREDGGRGGAPVLYFLWSQRWDIYRTFGVGPKHRLAPSPMTGVVRPPVDPESGTNPPVTDVTLEESEPSEDDLGFPFGTMDEWHTRWDSFLESFAINDAKPTDDEMAEMIATLPVDITDSPKAILAVEYNKARRRAEAKRAESMEMG